MSDSGATANSTVEDSDDLLPGSGRFDWRGHWAATGTATRWLLRSATALGLVAVGMGFVAHGAHERHATRTVTVAAPAAAITTNATGCPATARCDVTGAAPDGLLAAFGRVFPAIPVLSGGATLDHLTRRPYRVWLTASATDLQYTVAAQCIPGAAAITENIVSSADSGVDLSGNSVVRARRFLALVPGRPGCSVAVELNNFSSAPLPTSQAVDLARDPAVQVTL